MSKPSVINDRQDNLFRNRLSQQLNPKRPLFRLSQVIDWAVIEKEFGKFYTASPGHPPKPVRLMTGLLMLQHMEGLSDERVVVLGVENPYWQYFCGYDDLQWEKPINPSSLTRWRKRLGKEGVEKILSLTVVTALKIGHTAEKDCSQVIADTTVMEKAIEYPLDSKLLHKARKQVVNLAKEAGIALRQTYTRLGRAGDELTSGNFSLGNVSTGLVQANNTSMNQHMLSGSWHSGAFTQSDGCIQETTTASGAQIMDEKISSLASNLNVSESMQSMFQRQAARSEVAAQNQMMAASHQESRAYRDTIDLARHQATNKSLSTGYSDSNNTSLGKSLSRIHDKTQSFAQQNNMSYEKASQLLGEVSATVGGSLGPKGINLSYGATGKADIASRSNKSESYQKAENFIEQQNLREDFNIVRQASRDQRSSIGDDIGQRYAESISSSFDKADQFRREASASLQRSQSFTESASESNQQGWSISDNLTQDYLEWLSEQSYMGSGRPMGTSQAKHIVLNNEGMNRAYQREFLNLYQVGLDNYFDHLQVKSAEDVNKAYQQYTQSTSQAGSLSHHYSEVQAHAQKEGFNSYQDKEAGMDQEISRLKNEVEGLSNNQKATQTEQNIINFGDNLSRKVNKEQNHKIKKLEEARKSVNQVLSNENSEN